MEQFVYLTHPVMVRPDCIDTTPKIAPNTNVLTLIGLASKAHFEKETLIFVLLES